MKVKYIIEIFQDAKKEWRWHAKRSGRIVASSAGDGYKRKGTMEKTLVHFLLAIKADDYMINKKP